MKEGDSKTVNGFTVNIHKITEDQVYFARLGAPNWPGDQWALPAGEPAEEWPLYKMDRADFERMWEAEK